MKHKKAQRVVLAVLITSLTILFSPYLKAEYLTYRYSKEFVGLEQQTNMLNASRYFKVLTYSKKEAKVFYVSDTGDLITFFKNEEGNWEIKEWRTVWSKTGSADEFYWPYYR